MSGILSVFGTAQSLPMSCGEHHGDRSLAMASVSWDRSKLNSVSIAGAGICNAKIRKICLLLVECGHHLS